MRIHPEILRFNGFVLRRIARAQGPTRNVIMADLLREYSKTYETNGFTSYLTEHVQTHLRDFLQNHGYILVSPYNPLDRRIRPLCPTSHFPRPEERRRINQLAKIAGAYVVLKMNAKQSKYRAKVAQEAMYA